MLCALIVHSLALFFAPFAVQAAPELVGEWRGKAEVSGMSLEFQLAIRRDAQGELAGKVDIPAQNAKGLALRHFAFEEEKWRFRIEGVPGEPTFRGALSQDGARLVGELSQAGMRFPFAFERVDRDALLDAARARLAGLDEFVAAALEDWKTPGLALAVVNVDGLVLARGFGLRDREGELPVTADTLFAIGSTSKAFTAALLADLMEDGLLEWDAPVRRYLPSFQLEDEYATAHLSVRDLLTHRSGLPRHDLVWYGSQATRAELFDRLRHLAPTAGLRERFQYQNLMYMTAGYLTGVLTGTSWEAELERRLLEPLGMRGSVLSVETMADSEDRALGYAEKGKALEFVPYRALDAIGPAGSINSSANDMARWLRFLVDRGEIEGLRILTEATFDELLAPVTVVPRSPLDHEHAGQSTYALGWIVQSYRGKERIHHGGGIDGFTALVTVLPRERLGVVALSNRGGSKVPELATYRVLDALLELEPIDWSGLLKPVFEAAQREAAQQKKEETGKRIKGTQPAHPLADYAGEYEHQGYGRIRIALEGETLRLVYNSFDEVLEHWHYDTFRIAGGLAQGTLVQFRADTSGAIAELVAVLEPAVPALVFERRPPAELTDPAFLAALVGRYDLGPIAATVALRGAKPTVTVPGQPTYSLLPWREREYRLEGLAGYSLRVELSDGRCHRITFVQPDGTYPAERIED